MINNPAGRVVDHQVYCRQLQWKVAWTLPGSRKRITTPRSITHTTSMPLEMLVTTRSFCFLGTIYTVWETCTTTPMDRIQCYASIVESVTEVITEHKEFGTIWPSAWSSVCGHQTILKRRKKRTPDNIVREFLTDPSAPKADPQRPNLDCLLCNSKLKPRLCPRMIVPLPPLYFTAFIRRFPDPEGVY